MMWLARPKPLAAVAAALILATAGVAVQGRQQPAPDKTTPPPGAGTGAGAAAAPDLAANRALAREQLALIDQARDMHHQLFQSARVQYSDSAIWDRRKLETLRRTGAGKAEIIAALEKLITMLKDEEKICEQRAEAARGTQVDILDARFRRMEAGIWLNEEKAR